MIRQFGLYNVVTGDEETKQIGHRFRNETRSVLALFERYLKPPRESGKLWKVNIYVVERVRKPQPFDVLGVIKVQIEGDCRCFFCLTADEKRRQTLNWLVRGIEIVTQAYGWDIKPYADAREAVLDLNFKNHWTWRKRAWWRNGRRLAAEVFVEHEVEEIRIYIQLRNRSNEILERFLVVTDMPDEFVFDKYFGALQWIDDTTVKLVPKSWAEGSWSVTFDSCHFPD